MGIIIQILLLVLMSASGMNFHIADTAVGEVGESFIETLFTVSYDEATEFDESVTIEREKIVQSDSSSSFDSYYSSFIPALMVDRYGEWVDAPTLEFMIINGVLTNNYASSLQNEANYSVDNLRLSSEEIDEDTVKQRWLFDQLEFDLDNEWVETYEIEVQIHNSKESGKIIHFKILDVSEKE